LSLYGEYIYRTTRTSPVTVAFDQNNLVLGKIGCNTGTGIFLVQTALPFQKQLQQYVTELVASQKHYDGNRARTALIDARERNIKLHNNERLSKNGI
jgi:hypothetical protein